MNHPTDRFAGWRGLLPPIHPDGWPFVGIAAVATLILFLAWQPLGWIGLGATLWVAAFFRDPWRVSPRVPGLALAPADGEIVAVDEASPPPELDMEPTPMLRIGVYLGPLDVHINRAAVAGRVTRIAYRKGAFGAAREAPAGDENERNAIRVAGPLGATAQVQIAGRIARRIRCDLVEGQEVIAGQRIGLIRFGSRAEVYLPADWVPLVAVGQRAVAGETAIAAAPGVVIAAPRGTVTQ